MFQTIVKIEDLGIWIHSVDGMIKMHQEGNGADVTFPKERAQDVIDGILVVDWAINRRRMSAQHSLRRRKGGDKDG